MALGRRRAEGAGLGGQLMRAYTRRHRITISMTTSYRDAIHQIAVAAGMTDAAAARAMLQQAIRDVEAGKWELVDPARDRSRAAS